jgi:hypothetical protein
MRQTECDALYTSGETKIFDNSLHALSTRSASCVTNHGTIARWPPAATCFVGMNVGVTTLAGSADGGRFSEPRVFTEQTAAGEAGVVIEHYNRGRTKHQRNVPRKAAAPANREEHVRSQPEKGRARFRLRWKKTQTRQNRTAVSVAVHRRTAARRKRNRPANYLMR